MWISPSENAMKLALKFPHVLVARTFSKAYSLCFQRVGYFVGHPELIARAAQDPRQLQRERPGPDRRRGDAGRLAILPRQFQENHRHARKVGPGVDQARLPGFPEPDEFHSGPAAVVSRGDWFQKLRDQKILVRWFSQPEVKDYLRITIGTPAEAAALVTAARKIWR